MSSSKRERAFGVRKQNIAKTAQQLRNRGSLERVQEKRAKEALKVLDEDADLRTIPYKDGLVEINSVCGRPGVIFAAAALLRKDIEVQSNRAVLIQCLQEEIDEPIKHIAAKYIKETTRDIGDEETTEETTRDIGDEETTEETTRDIGVQTDPIGQGFTGFLRLEDLQRFLTANVPIYTSAPEQFQVSDQLWVALPQKGKRLFEVDGSGRPLIQLEHDYFQDLVAYTQSNLEVYT